MKPDVKAFFDEATNTVSYVVRDPQGRACAVIDSVLDFDQASGRTDTRSADAIAAHVRAERKATAAVRARAARRAARRRLARRAARGWPGDDEGGGVTAARRARQ